MKCNYCKNKLIELDTCKFCHFEPEDYYTRDDWDILNLDDDYEWGHLQILYRLHAKGLPCLFADTWLDNNIAWLIGCNVFTSKLAEVLGVHVECIYNQSDQSFVIINLFQEKCIRMIEEYELDKSDEAKNELVKRLIDESM